MKYFIQIVIGVAIVLATFFLTRGYYDKPVAPITVVDTLEVVKMEYRDRLDTLYRYTVPSDPLGSLRDG